MTDYINLVKLCVGAEGPADLEQWQRQRAAERADGLPRHVTRMWPRREAALLAGGSLYWVFKGVILARQRVLRLDEAMGADGIRRCAIVLDPVLHRTAPAPRRPFQGWRYLAPEDAPADLDALPSGLGDMPAEMLAELRQLGLL